MEDPREVRTIFWSSYSAPQTLMRQNVVIGMEMVQHEALRLVALRGCLHRKPLATHPFVTVLRRIPSNVIRKV
jgi:hypothetical protein